MKQGGLFDTPSGKDRKAAGTERVLDNAPTEWKDEAFELLLRLRQERDEFSSEDLRVIARDQGLEEPHHPNCWGAVFARAAKSAIIERCGFRKNGISSTHARMVGVWRRT